METLHWMTPLRLMPTRSMASEHICTPRYVGLGAYLLDVVTRNVSDLAAFLLAVNEQPVVILAIHVENLIFGNGQLAGLCCLIVVEGLDY